MPKEKLKEKIAISIDPSLLSALDSYIDGAVIRSRSQAIEVMLKRAMKEYGVKQAVLLLKAEHVPLALQAIDGKPLLKRQHEFLSRNGITKLLILTQQHKELAKLQKLLHELSPNSELIVQDVKGSAAALRKIRPKLGSESFIVMDGDTLMDFDLGKMIKRHLESGKRLTMGLIQSPVAERYTSVNLDGDSVTELHRKKHGLSRVIDAGIYIMRPEVFEHIPKSAKSLAADVFPKLVKQNQVLGYFTFGQYMHVAE